MTRRIHWIGWDADGTLIDSRVAAFAVAEAVLMEWGKPTRIDTVEKYEVGWADVVHSSSPETRRMLGDRHTLLMQEFRTPAFSEMLDVAMGLEIEQFIVTATRKSRVERELGDSCSHFAAILGRELGEKRTLLARLMSRGTGLYIGDTASDVGICQSLGLEVVALVGGFHTKKRLEAAQPDHLIESRSDLGPFLDRLISERENS